MSFTMRLITYCLASLTLISVTCDAYMTHRHSPYPDLPYNYYGNLRRQRNFYAPDQVRIYKALDILC